MDHTRTMRCLSNRRLWSSVSSQSTTQTKRCNLSTLTKPQSSPTPLYLNFLAPAWASPTNHGISRAPRTKRWTQISEQNRTFRTSTSHSASAVQNPRKDDHGNEMTITILPRAAHRLQAIAETDKNPDLALRVSVESGGCHGFQYLMSLTTIKEIDPEEDTLFENATPAKSTGDYKAKVVMDEASLELLKGSSIDYTMELIGSQFKVTGIPGATSSCGCGTSFDIAA